MARPHGILTRFPILPSLLGHPDAFIYKEQIVIDADTITLRLTLSIPGHNQSRLLATLLRQLASSKIQRNFNAERAAD